MFLLMPLQYTSSNLITILFPFSPKPFQHGIALGKPSLWSIIATWGRSDSPLAPLHFFMCHMLDTQGLCFAQ